MSLNNLALDLSARREQLGEIQDLNGAIVLSREVLTLRPQGHPLRSRSLNNLSANLSIRYKGIEVMQDLREAISLS